MNGIVKQTVSEARKLRVVIEFPWPIQPKEHAPDKPDVHGEEKQKAFIESQKRYETDVAEIRKIHNGRAKIQIIQ